MCGDCPLSVGLPEVLGMARDVTQRDGWAGCGLGRGIVGLHPVQFTQLLWFRVLDPARAEGGGRESPLGEEQGV